MRNILVDTGALIALFNPKDRFHSQAFNLFSSLKRTDKLLTTWPVITECSFALLRNRDHFYDWLAQDVLQVENFDLDDFDFMRRWIKHSDRQIDFADASMVWLAIHKKTDLIATTDFNDFETYRLPNKKPFKILLNRL